jgi:cell division protein FtsQ
LEKVNYKHVGIVALWCIAIAGLVGSLAFVSKSEKNIVASNLNIVLHNTDENLFLNEAEVRKYLNNRNDKILSERYRNLNTAELEKALNAHQAIENAEVSEDLNGEIKLEILQRTPVLRVINKSGESYYIDSQDKLMPLNENYTAHVLIASGELFEPYDRRYQFSVAQIAKNKLFSEVSMLDDVLAVAKKINADTVLSAMIHQIYVNKDKDIELFPVVGNHRVIFGENKDTGEKLNKLKLFYTEGLNKSDSWTKYSAINLKYKNLVVCTKK